jgi:hypothetical protein
MKNNCFGKMMLNRLQEISVNFKIKTGTTLKDSTENIALKINSK